MVNILGIIIVTVIVAVIGGGGFWLLWILTRPKKQTWKARVYQLGEGIKPPIKDKDGKIISDIKLSDLKPYTKDILQKTERAHGIVLYKLSKLNKTTPPVTNDAVEYWGEHEKEVAVLIDGETCTILKKGYDRTAGIIFNPMPHDRINMITGETTLRKERLRKEKDILQAITPWIVTGIAMMGLVAMIYIAVDGFITISENIAEAQEQSAEIQLQTSRILAGGKLPGEKEVKEEEPPSVE